jgi:putative Mn2+ efflux pump MntP
MPKKSWIAFGVAAVIYAAGLVLGDVAPALFGRLEPILGAVAIIALLYATVVHIYSMYPRDFDKARGRD